MKVVALALSFFCFTVCTEARPKGPTVAHGAVSVVNDGPRTQISIDTDSAIINWERFSISRGESVQFIQTSRNASVLNRVKSASDSKSLIQGALRANGKVFLINESGVIITKGAVIDTAKFLGGSFDVLDTDFLKNGEILFFGEGSGEVINEGKIISRDGDITLVGAHVANSGQLSAENGEVQLAAGRSILLRPEGKEKVFIQVDVSGAEKGEVGIEHKGVIEALAAELKADGNLYKLAINDAGRTDALGKMERGGRLYLTADGGRIEISGEHTVKQGEMCGGQLRVKGETVHIGNSARVNLCGLSKGGEADFSDTRTLHVESGALITADATQEGAGGKLIFWGNEENVFKGSAYARGKRGGAGGFVEVSSRGRLDFYGSDIEVSRDGAVGDILFDPSDVIIRDAASENATFENGRYTISADSCVIDGQQLSVFLKQANVTIDTAGPGGAEGTITVEDGFYWYGDTSLVMNATKRILLKDTVHAELGRNGTITLNAPYIQMGDGTQRAVAGIVSEKGAGIFINANKELKMVGGATDVKNRYYSSRDPSRDYYPILGYDSFASIQGHGAPVYIKAAEIKLIGQDAWNAGALIQTCNAPINIQAVGSITMNSSFTGTVKNCGVARIALKYGSDIADTSITVIAGRDLTIKDNSFVRNNVTDGRINLVVDNQYRTDPGCGLGAFVLGPSSFVASSVKSSWSGGGIEIGAGNVILYASQPEHVHIEGGIDGALAQAAVENGEVGVYYPEGEVKNGLFTVYYKNPAPKPKPSKHPKKKVPEEKVQVVERTLKASPELLWNLQEERVTALPHAQHATHVDDD